MLKEEEIYIPTRQNEIFSTDLVQADGSLKEKKAVDVAEDKTKIKTE
jgi:hypothetical protein